MNAFFKGRIMPVGDQPLLGRMVLHVGQLVLEIDADGQLAKGLGFLGWKDVDDALEVVGHGLAGVQQELAVFLSLEGRIELDGPSLDFLNHGLGEGVRVLLSGFGALSERRQTEEQGAVRMRWRLFMACSFVLGDGESAGENHLIVDLDEDGIVARGLELEAVDVVDQVDPVMRAG